MGYVSYVGRVTEMSDRAPPAHGGTQAKQGGITRSFRQKHARTKLARARAVLRWPALVLTVILALGLSGCPEDPPVTPEAWSLVFENLPASLIGVWGNSATDVYAVGGDTRDGKGGLVLHYDGTEWARIAMPTGTATLWWVFGFEGGPVFMSGVGGTIVRYEGGTATRMTTPGTGTVWGVWGASPSDLWAVGGIDGTHGAFVWHFDGSSWSDQPLPAGLADTHALFKVWGRSATDFVVVGSGGVALHHEASGFVQDESGAGGTLLTVHGNGERYVAVGGLVSGIVLEKDAAGWHDVTPTDAAQMNGVCLTRDGGFAAGFNGRMLERVGGAWQELETGVEAYEDFHAVWVDPDGGVWAVGGRFNVEPTSSGQMVHRGAAVPGGTFRE